MEIGRAGNALAYQARSNNVKPRPHKMARVAAQKVVQLNSAAFETRTE